MLTNTMLLCLSLLANLGLTTHVEEGSIDDAAPIAVEDATESESGPMTSEPAEADAGDSVDECMAQCYDERHGLHVCIGYCREGLL